MRVIEKKSNMKTSENVKKNGILTEIRKYKVKTEVEDRCANFLKIHSRDFKEKDTS